MMTDLMSERSAADEFFAGAVREKAMPSRSIKDFSDELSQSKSGCKRLAAMPVPELLFHALFGEKEIADELT